MNLRVFSIAILASAIPLSLQAGEKRISLNQGDFISAKQISQHGEALISVKLSKSGKAKIRKLGQQSQGGKVHAEIAGVKSDLLLRDLIQGGALEIEPLSQLDVGKASASNNSV